MCNEHVGRLYDEFGVTGRALPRISDFLRRRQFRVKGFRHSQGVPQGSVLSPILFAFFTAGIEKEISQGSEIGIFADDIIIWKSGGNIDTIESKLNSSLKSIQCFAGLHKLNFNPKKLVTIGVVENPQYSTRRAVHIFTYGSKIDSGNTGSGVVIKNKGANTKIKRRNPNHCPVLRSELIAINAALEHMISIKGTRDIWIFTNSKRSIQYLRNWRNIGDRIGPNIIDNAKTYSTHNDIHLQWILSHVNLYFNDLANELAKEGSNDPIDSSDLLTYNEIYSKVKADNNRTWKTPPSHDWYQQNGPGAALELKGDRKLPTAITRLISDHTRGLTFVQGQKTFHVCLKCNIHQASSEHLLSC
ncbi:RNase H domain-containing protein [Trichonephila clavipes]|nr:RNase H domain-containing protein [Trichonephila clavipes]